MDVAYTFDATILHEMTHAVPNAATEDAGGKSDSYGEMIEYLYRKSEANRLDLRRLEELQQDDQ